MKILVTGANGFIGKNLISELYNIKFKKSKHQVLSEDITIYEYDIDTPKELLSAYTKDCDFVCHLAGVNRPDNEEEFMRGNFGFTSELLDLLKSNSNKAPILVSSSVHAEGDTPYGKSKRAGEQLMFEYSRENDVKVCVYRFQNVFGKWCRPNYNSAVATFCNNIARGLDITVNDPEVTMNLVYIDDVVEEIINAICGKENRKDDYCYVPVVHTAKLGDIVKLIYSFRESRKELGVPRVDNEFEKKLYSTYLSYLPEDEFSYPLKMNVDHRGSFTEIVRTSERGQFSVNVAKPGITKGNHWHHTKTEKFLVVSGKALLRFRKIGEEKVIEYHLTGDKMEVVDIPVGYTHSIVNEGDTDLVTVLWCNECFDPEKPDTYFEEV